MYKNLLIIIISLILGLNLLNADSDNPNYNIKDEETGTGNEPSQDYKVKDFYGTWVVVKVRFMYYCDFNDEIPLKIEYLGKKIIIQPSFFQSTLHEPLKEYEKGVNFIGIPLDKFSRNAYLGRKNVFYSTEIYDAKFQYGGGGRIANFSVDLLGADRTYEALLVLNKNINYHDEFGDYDMFFIKNKDTLVYYMTTISNSKGPYTLYMLIRESEAKKLDKYSIYVPTTKIEDEPGRFDYEKLEKYYPGCSAEYDEYANKLIKEGKYNVIRDNTMARDFIDIE